MDHTINLFNRYEQVLFAQQTNDRPVSCVIVTGFLGSGKTTLVNHLLRHKSDLRLAVLVNEVGAIDIDGQLVSLQQTNAAVGAVSRQLAGGCACCEVIGDLKSATKDLLAANQDLDYLVLETSGAADVEPMVDVMREVGLQVDGVVAVVDAEAALQQLAAGVAVQQVKAADLVVLNKCDLATLGQMSTAEDRIRALVPSTAIVRARHAQVDPELLFCAPATEQDNAQVAATCSQADGSTAAGSVTGQVAFMSHESAPVLRPAGSALATAALRSRRPQQATSTTDTGNGHGGHANNGCVTPPEHGPHPPHMSGNNSHRNHEQEWEQHHHSSHQGHHHHHQHQEHVATRSFSADRPLSLAWFQRFVVQELLPTPGLLRAKGLLWFLEEPVGRFTFHVSGRRRVECHTSEPWSCPPGCQLVLIGQSAQHLDRLCSLLEAAVGDAASGTCCRSSCSMAEPQPSTAGQPGVADSKSTATAHSSASPQDAAAALRALISEHPRFAVLEQQHSSLVAAASQSTALVEFTVVGSPLHGVFPEAVNADVLVKVNGSGELLLSSRKVAGTISSTSLRQSPFKSVALLLAVEDAAGAVSAWGRVAQLAAPVLRKAFAHVHNCGCDVHTGPT